MAIPTPTSARKKVKALDQKESAGVPSGEGLPTDIPRLRETTRGKLALVIVIGLFVLLTIISLFLFLLIILNKSEASLFKDILLSFIGFASGVLVSVFGFYFRGPQENKE